MTQTDFGALVGLTQGEISHIERGTRSISDLDRLVIARVLGRRSVERLFSYEDSDNDGEEGAA